MTVLVVGGGLTGLSAAVFLAFHGVDCLVVEQHATTSVHPRARGLTLRTMELLRGVGLEDAVLAAGEPVAPSAIAYQLTDQEYQWLGDAAGLYPRRYGSSRPWLCDQECLEPLLLARARELGAEVRFGTELTGLEQGGDGVTATVRDRLTGCVATVAADYLIAADGAGSSVREFSGITSSGRGTLGEQVSVVFRADLEPAVRDREFVICRLESVRAVLIPRGRPDARFWQIGLKYDRAAGERFEDFTPQRCIDAIRVAVGLPDAEIQVDSVLRWRIAAMVADRFRDRRVLLAGDAAHVMPPSGGFGSNTGIQDVHNLAWKLAMLLRGTGGPALLDSYQEERRPVALFTVDQALARARNDPTALPKATVASGYRYHSSIIVADATVPDHQPHAYESPRCPSGRPGTRAAHIVVQRHGRQLSTLDLLGAGFTLFTGELGQPWIQTAERAHIDVDTYRFGSDIRDVEGRWPQDYGVGPDGAVLVRPDGFIGWRMPHLVDAPAAVLARAIDTLCGRRR